MIFGHVIQSFNMKLLQISLFLLFVYLTGICQLGAQDFPKPLLLDRSVLSGVGLQKIDLKDEPEKDFYQKNEISSDSVARAIAYAIEQPADVDINEIVIRPTVQEF